jgi:hypothetical protein
MPEEVRRIREPWRSLVGRVPHLTADLERSFRFGHRVVEGEGGDLVGGSMKGGSSQIWKPAGPGQRAAYEAWLALDGVRPRKTPAGFEALRAFLAPLGIELREPDRGLRPMPPLEFHPEYGEAYEVVLAILRGLPSEHLARPELRAIQLGGFGPDAAKASSYEAGCVTLYELAVRGARRTLAGLLLHELGHAHERAFTADRRDALRRCWLRLGQSGAFPALEYLGEGESRRRYQQMAFEEFLAETYLSYTACGAWLRSFIAALPLADRDAWTRAYAIFRESFGGLEYE